MVLQSAFVWAIHDKAMPAIWHSLAQKESVPLSVPRGSLISNPLKSLTLVTIAEGFF